MSRSRFDEWEFLRELSLARDNLKRCNLVDYETYRLIDAGGLERGVSKSIQKIPSKMIKKGLYNIDISIPDVRRLTGRAGQATQDPNPAAGLEELIFSCHTDAIKLSPRDSVGPGVNDNGSGVVVLLKDMEDCLMKLNSRLDQDEDLDIAGLPRTRYLFFSGEEGSLKGVAYSLAASASAFAFILISLSEKFDSHLMLNLASTAYSLTLMEWMARSNLFSSGLCGSQYWTNMIPKEEKNKPRILVNFDMVGNYGLSAEGGLKGFVKELQDNAVRNRAERTLKRARRGYGVPQAEITLDRPEDAEKLKTAVVPTANIGVNPFSWVSPIRHDALAKHLGEIIYVTGVETGRYYNVRDSLGLGSSDHAAVQQVSDKRKLNIKSAMVIGLGGMARRREIHTKRDISVERSDLEFSSLVAERLVKTPRSGWKDYSQVEHLDDIRYASVFGKNDGDDNIAVLRAYEQKRDTWVNLYFKAGEAGKDSAIEIQPSDFIDWDLQNNLLKKGTLREYSEYGRLKPEGQTIRYKGKEYSLEKPNEFFARGKGFSAGAARFFSDRMILGLYSVLIPLSIGVGEGTDRLTEQITDPFMKGALVVGSLALTVLGTLQLAKLPLRYSNVLAETLYDIEAARANSQLHKATLLSELL